MVHVLVGSNWFALKQKLDEHVLEFEKKHGQLTIQRFYAPDIEFDNVEAALASVSLFTEDKLIILTDPSGNKIIRDRIEELINKCDTQTTLIIVETSADKRSGYYKSLKKQPNFQEFSELNEASLLNWILDFTQHRSGDISPADARFLIERVGQNQTIIERELAKLVHFNPHITRQSIELLTEQTPMSTVFNLVDAAFSGNITRALNMYDEQRALRKEPQAILGMLIWQMHVVAIVLAAGSKNSDEIARETGMNAYVVGKAQGIARRMGLEKVRDFLTLLRDIEYTSKKQTYDLDDALKHAILRLAN